MIWRAFADPRSAVRHTGAKPLALAFLALLAIELAAYQVWLVIPPFSDRSREPTADIGSTRAAAGQLVDPSRSWLATLPRTWQLCQVRATATGLAIGAWFAIGLLGSRRPWNLTGLATAVVCSTAILTAGRLARQAFTYAVGVDPGLFGFGSLLGDDAGWLSRFGRLTVFEVWSAVVLAIGLSEAWQRPFQFLLPIVMGILAAWTMFPGIRDPYTWLRAVQAIPAVLR